MRPRSLMLAMACVALSACATPPMAEQQPTLANIQALRAADVPPLTPGDFVLAPGRPASMDRSITIRASTMRAPGDGSFARYLQQTLETELRAAGKLDTAGSIIVSGQLTQSLVDSEPPNGEGTLAARFVVTRAGQVIYDQELTVHDVWRTSFAGAIAIPAAIDRYTALYPALVRAFVTDPRLGAALRQP